MSDEMSAEQERRLSEVLEKWKTADDEPSVNREDVVEVVNFLIDLVTGLRAKVEEEVALRESIEKLQLAQMEELQKAEVRVEELERNKKRYAEIFEAFMPPEEAAVIRERIAALEAELRLRHEDLNAAITREGLHAEQRRVLTAERDRLREALNNYCECPGSYHTRCRACESAYGPGAPRRRDSKPEEG